MIAHPRSLCLHMKLFPTWIGIAGALFACFALPFAAAAQESEADSIVMWDVPEWPETVRSDWSKETKLKLLNGAVLGGMMTYGLLYWHYGETSFQFVNEGWFDPDTIHGGADKLGHAISTYFGVMAYSAIYDHWGYDQHRASLYGTLSSWATFFMIEVGDGFSRHGFSVEDLAADTVGAFTGYLRREWPAFSRRVDFRVSYFPSYGERKGKDADYCSDYSGFKYLLALKGDGFDCISSTWLRYLELQMGYYTRGYQDQDGDHYGPPMRTLYAAVGVNLSQIFDKQNWNKTAAFLHYYQPPYTFVPVDFDLDD